MPRAPWVANTLFEVASSASASHDSMPNARVNPNGELHWPNTDVGSFIYRNFNLAPLERFTASNALDDADLQLRTWHTSRTVGSESTTARRS